MSAPVLVTGASTGIGRATAERLAGGGIPVLAGVRTPADAEALGAVPGVEPLILDVTDTAHVAALGERLGGHALRGLVNNAGITVPGPLEELALDDLRRQFEVNLFGAIAVTQAALPALRTARGRIVNVGSIGGRVGQPFVGAYCGTKGALHLMSASLRRELRPFGVWVACVEPGAIDTAIWGKGEASSDELLARFSPDARARYAAHMGRVRELAEREARRALAPAEAARRIEHALTAGRPRAYYLLGPDAWILWALDRMLPARLADRALSRLGL